MMKTIRNLLVAAALLAVVWPSFAAAVYEPRTLIGAGTNNVAATATNEGPWYFVVDDAEYACFQFEATPCASNTGNAVLDVYPAIGESYPTSPMWSFVCPVNASPTDGTNATVIVTNIVKHAYGKVRIDIANTNAVALTNLTLIGVKR